MKKICLLCLLPALLLFAFPALGDCAFNISHISDDVLIAGSTITISVSATEDAMLKISLLSGDETYVMGSNPIGTDTTIIEWNGKINGQMMPDGSYTLEMALSDLEGNLAMTDHFDLLIRSPVSAEASFTPAMNSPYPCEHENCYWSTPMDITDTKAVWAMLMSKTTVIKGGQKDQVVLYEKPDEASVIVADVTCLSQAVHVLQTLDSGWSLVEVYSSSFTADSKAKAYNEFTQGYIKTSMLIEKEPGNKEYAMVVDKLTQHLYLFKNGELLAELLCSTGTVGKDNKLYNETRSGEFFLVSPMGEFASEELLCSYAMRFNAGDALHEVPHILNADGSFSYRKTEPYLGEKASHGCIRVQRLKNPDGINMRWIWNELYSGLAGKHIKLAIWEDFPGRQIPTPDPSSVIYYNPNGGTNYHSRETCMGVKDKYLPLTPFTYGQLDMTPYSALTPCAYCTPLRTMAQIEKVNLAHQE